MKNIYFILKKYNYYLYNYEYIKAHISMTLLFLQNLFILK